MQILPTKLGARLMMWVATAVILVFVAFMVILLRAEKRQNLTWTSDMAEVILKTTEKSTEQAMNQGDMKAIQSMLERVAEVGNIEVIRILDDKGKVTRSSNTAEIGRTLGDAFVQDTLRSTRHLTSYDEPSQTMRIAQPLINTGTCVECHRTSISGESLGVLDLSISTRDKKAAVIHTTWIMTMWAVVMVVVVCVMLFFLIHRTVLRHIANLSSAARQMADGNTRIQVNVDHRDEIGLLGEAFNRMSVNIGDAQERNTSLISGIPDPLVTVDSWLTVTFINGAMEQLTGYRKEEAEGKVTCDQLFHSAGDEQCHGLKAIVEGRETTSTSRDTLTNRAGRCIPVIATNSVLRNAQGQIVGALAIIRDISSEVESEKKLANEVSWSGSVIKAIADPIFTIDREKNVTYINDAAVSLSGYRREEAVGQKCYRIFRGDICRKECIYDRCLQEGESVHGISRNVLPREGAEVLARASGSVLLTSDGVAVGFLEIMRDVTDEQRNIDNLLEILKHIQTASETIIIMARTILQNSEEQKRSVSEQSSSVKEVATTIEELDMTSQQTVDKAEGVVGTAQKMVQISQNGQKAVEETIEVMTTIRNRVDTIAEQINDLSQQAQQIGSIITAVNDLAEQTNLLALNAAIEAARAGEHGRGFTVVAMEVKKLAEQSQAATAKISLLIGEVQQATRTCVQVTEEGSRGVEEGVRFAAQAGDTIQKVMGNIANTADAVQQISTIAKQQSVGIQQVSMAMATINTGMNQTTRSAESLSTAAEEFNRLADRLNELVRKYKL